MSTWLFLGLVVNFMLVFFNFAEFNLVPISRLKSAGRQVRNEEVNENKKDVPARKLNQNVNDENSESKEHPSSQKESDFKESRTNNGLNARELVSEQSSQILQTSGPSSLRPAGNEKNIPSATTRVRLSTRRVENQINFTESEQRTDLKDIFISVKTTVAYHRTRVLDTLLNTWIALAKTQVMTIPMGKHFFSL